MSPTEVVILNVEILLACASLIVLVNDLFFGAVMVAGQYGALVFASYSIKKILITNYAISCGIKASLQIVRPCKLITVAMNSGFYPSKSEYCRCGNA